MKLIAVRLPDDVAAEVEEQAKKQERSKSAVIIRALRTALGINQNIGVQIRGRKISNIPVSKDAKEVVIGGSALDNNAVHELARYRKCQHGDNEYTCERTACKIKTGR